MSELLTITDSAKEHFNRILKQSPDAIGIRLALKKSGCSGFAYVVDIAKSQEDDEVLQEINGVPVVAKQSLLDKELAGTELDYVKEGINSLLKFKNPNVESECGCGESITFKDKGS